jgi:major vault protein
VLREDESLLLSALNSFKDENDKVRLPGTIWMKQGPCDYIPRVEIKVIEIRKSYPLDKNEGIYVKDKKSGEVKLIQG